MFNTFHWKSEVHKEQYDIYDPWDPKTESLRAKYNFNDLVSFDIQEVPVKLNLESHSSFIYIFKVLQNFFSVTLEGRSWFLTDENLCKFVDMWLHSLRHTSITFIDRWSLFLKMSYPAKHKLMRMLGICKSYLISPELYELVVPTQSKYIKTNYSFPDNVYEDVLGGLDNE